MSATGFNLSAALAAIGAGRVFIGDPFTENGMDPLPTEGAISATMPQELNVLTAPELTGGVPHDAFVTDGEVSITVPVIYGGAETLALFSAHGAAHSGYSSPRRPTYTSLAIIPLTEMTTDDPPSIGYDGTDWTPATPPVHALWFWKVTPLRPDMSFAWENGGKVIIPVTFRAFYDSARPSGHRVFTQGNPVAAGITTLRI